MAKTDATKTMSEILSELIIGSGMDYRPLAAAIGISQASLSKYAANEAEPGLTALVKLADYFGVTIDYLAGRTDTKSPDPKLQEAVELTGLTEQAITMIVTQKTPDMQGKYGDTCWEEIPELRKLIDLLCSSQAGVDAMQYIYQYISPIEFARDEKTETIRGHEVLWITTIEDGEEKRRGITADYMREFQRKELLKALKKLQNEATGKSPRSKWVTIDDIIPPDLD